MLVLGNVFGLIIQVELGLSFEVRVWRGGIEKKEGYFWVGRDSVEKRWQEWGFFLYRLLFESRFFRVKGYNLFFCLDSRILLFVKEECWFSISFGRRNYCFWGFFYFQLRRGIYRCCLYIFFGLENIMYFFLKYKLKKYSVFLAIYFYFRFYGYRILELFLLGEFF